MYVINAYVCVMTVVVGYRGGMGDGSVVGHGGVVSHGCGVVGNWGSVVDGLVVTYDALRRHSVAMSQKTGVGSGQQRSESYDL